MPTAATPSACRVLIVDDDPQVRTALADAVGQRELTLIVNTADDLWIHGLRGCPDLDVTTIFGSWSTRGTPLAVGPGQNAQ